MKKCNSFQEYFASKAFVESLATLIGPDSPHTLILAGPEGAGKKTWANALANANLCEHPTEDGACCNCPSCHYFQEETHPDVIRIFPAEKNKTIPLDLLREKVHKEIDLRPQIGKAKIWIIDADALMESAQNALLKTLEEPPAYAKFYLLSKEPSRLLGTLLSRARKVDIPPLPDDAIRSLLEKEQIEEKKMTLAIAFAHGLPGLALDLASNKEFWSIREAVVRWFLHFPPHNRAEVLTADFQFFEKYKTEIHTVFLFLQALLRDVVLIAEDADEKYLMQEDLAKALRKFTNYYHLEAKHWSNMNKAVNEAAKRLKANGNFEMHICTMLLEMREEFHYADSSRR